VFALKLDCRPANERAAKDRYAQPTFLERMHRDPSQNSFEAKIVFEQREALSRDEARAHGRQSLKPRRLP
jgi:hypothetical protein